MGDERNRTGMTDLYVDGLHALVGSRFTDLWVAMACVALIQRLHHRRNKNGRTHLPRLVTPMPHVKSSIFLPSPSVTYEPSALVKTASTTRPSPAVTCFLPNCTKDSCDCVDVDAMLRFWPE